MQKKQVAVIDIGSSKITAVIGERGTNKTFIIKGRYSCEYDGFENGEFFDLPSMQDALKNVVVEVKKNLLGSVQTVYVGVPGDFTKVFMKDSQISFAKKKKITEEDVDALFDAAFMLTSSSHTLINRSAVVYELDDFRRLANPVGAVSTLIKPIGLEANTAIWSSVYFVVVPLLSLKPSAMAVSLSIRAIFDYPQYLVYRICNCIFNIFDCGKLVHIHKVLFRTFFIVGVEGYVRCFG